MRALRWLGRGVLVAVLLVLGTAGWMLGSESGLRVLVGQLEARGLLEAGSVQGRLLGRLEVEQAALHLPGLDMDVDRFVLDWRPQALLRGQLHVLELTGAGIRLALQPTEPSAPARSPEASRRVAQAPSSGSPSSRPLGAKASDVSTACQGRPAPRGSTLPCSRADTGWVTC